MTIPEASTSTKKLSTPQIILVVIGTIIVLCCICPVAFNIIGRTAGFIPTSTPRPTTDTSVSAIQTAAVATARAEVQAAGPTQTRTSPIPNTPTPQPVMAMDLAQFVAKYDSLTDIQKKDFTDQSTGQWVNWSGEVFDVNNDATVTINIPGTLASTVSLKGISKEDAIKLSKKDTITFTGRIDSIIDLLGLHIYIVDAQLTAETTQAPDTQLPASTDAPAPAANNVGSVGERVESGGIALTVVSVSTTGSINSLLTAKEGYTYLVVEVVIENTARTDETPYNLLYFSVKDSDGFQYTPAMLAPDTALTAGDLPQGDKVRGNIAFEVKSTASGFVISYEPIVIFGGYTPIRINLGQ